MGELTDRVHRELTEEDIATITRAYHAWRGEAKDGVYEDEAGFCYSATLEEVKKNNFVLTPGRYVGIEEEEDDGVPFEEKMERLTAELGIQMKQSAKLDERIKENLRDLGYEVE